MCGMHWQEGGIRAYSSDSQKDELGIMLLDERLVWGG